MERAPSVSTVSLIPTDTSVALPTAVINLAGGGRRSCTRAFFDTGAQRSFIHAELAQKLCLPVIDEINLTISPFDSPVQHLRTSVVKVTVRLGNMRTTIRAVVHNNVDTIVRTPGISQVATMLRNHKIKLADSYESDVVQGIGLVIGADNYHKFVNGQQILQGINLLSCASGCIIFGPLPNWAVPSVSPSSNELPVNLTYVVCARVSATDLQVENMWKLDTIGITHDDFTPDQKLALQHFDSSILYDRHNKCYKVDLPFRNDELRPPTNHRKALGQLLSLKRSFVNNPKLFDEYNNIFVDYVNKGFIEKADNDFQCHYLPHHGVRKESMTTPLRIVYNASSQASPDQPSLNSCLLTGHSLTSTLFDYLVGFRMHPFAVVADISKAFLRIMINEDHRNFAKFLWFKDDSLTDICAFRFRVVMFGATSSPFLLQRTISYHLENHPEPLANNLLHHFYVDNFAKCYDSVENLVQEYPKINRILLEANMPLQEWISNVPEFNESIGCNVTSLVNVLGLNWDVHSDSLSVKPSQLVISCAEIDSSANCTLPKRKVIATVASIFGPLGFTTPLYVKSKIFIKNLWSRKLGWDILPPDLCKEFISQCKNLRQIPQVLIPRFAIVPNQCELHIFCDASKDAYGFVVYSVQLELHKSLFLLSKVRVTPSKDITIRKLELTSIYFACNFAQTLMSNPLFSFVKVTFWSDSKVAIHWVLNNRSTNIYVTNRVSKIRSFLQCLKYVPTADNPADLLTRGISFQQLHKSKIWASGPSWLTNPSDYPPQDEFEAIVTNEILVEPRTADPIVPCLDVSKYSTLKKSLSVIQHIYKFLSSFQCVDFEPQVKPLLILVCLAQKEHDLTLINYLREDGVQPVSRDLLNFANQLGLYLDKFDLIRCHGRVEHSSLPLYSKDPVLLPPKSALTN